MPLWNFQRFFNEVSKDVDQCIAFCEREKLIPTQKLCSRGYFMKLHRSLKTHRFGVFLCQLKHNEVIKHKERCSRFRDTFFENIKITVEKMLLITLCFANNVSVMDTVRETSDEAVTTSIETVVDCFNRCREIIADYCLSTQNIEDPIGGIDKIVEIREFKIGQAKYKLKHGLFKAGYLVLGMAETSSKRFKIEIIPEYSEDEITTVVVPLIQKHVLPGTHIFGNSTIRNLLKKFGYTSVSSTKETPYGGSSWKLKRNCRESNLAGQYIEHLFKQHCHKENVIVFDKLLDAIRYNFPE